MNFTNLEYDMICEGLELMVHDRYAMPKDLAEFRKKLVLITLLYDRIQDERPTKAEKAEQ